MDKAPAAALAQAGEAITRLICASVTRIDGSVLELLLAMRGQIGAFNAANNLCVAYLYGNGWFFQWMEGPQLAVDKVLRISRADPRHHHQRVLHRSLGSPTLRQPLQIATLHGNEKPADVARRLQWLKRELAAQRFTQPDELWQQLAAPLRLPGIGTTLLSQVPRHLVAVISEATESVDLVRSLGERFSAPVTYQRFAGGAPRSADVGAAYVDLAGRGQVARVQALSRGSLADPLVRLSLRQLQGVLLLMGMRPLTAPALADDVVALLRDLALRPAVRLAANDPESSRMVLEHLEGCSGDIAEVELAALQTAPESLLEWAWQAGGAAGVS
jgi:hypothetical protein